MKTSFITAVVSFIIGGILTFMLCYWMGPNHQTDVIRVELRTKNDQYAKLELQFKELQKRVRDAKPEAQQLTAPVATSGIGENAKAQGDTAPVKNHPFGNAMSSAIKMLFQQKLIAMKTRLKLSPEQESQIDAILKEEAGFVEKTTSGDHKMDVKNPPNFDKQIMAVLTPEQTGEFQKMQTEEKNTAAESMATLQMNQVASSLNLSEDQKDQVFAALVQSQQTHMDPVAMAKKKQEMIANGMKAEPADVYIELKREALSKVLTPAQMEIYNKQLDAERDMMRAVMQNLPAGVEIHAQ